MKIKLFTAALITLFIVKNAEAHFTLKDTGINNMLTAMEKQQGWKLLFDGKTLDGWRTYKHQPGSWEVKDGMLCSERSGNNTHADLITNAEFQNFELSIDWKISPKGNSGIMYLVTEENDATYESGPEYQLLSRAY